MRHGRSSKSMAVLFGGLPHRTTPEPFYAALGYERGWRARAAAVV
jgi:hypothetical protein